MPTGLGRDVLRDASTRAPTCSPSMASAPATRSPTVTPTTAASAATGWSSTPRAGPAGSGRPVRGRHGVTSSTVTLRWQPPVADGGSAVTGYVVRLGTEVVELAPEARSHTFSGLAPATAYTVSVLARTAVGDSPEVSRDHDDLGHQARRRADRHRRLGCPWRRGHRHRPLVRPVEHRWRGDPRTTRSAPRGSAPRSHPVHQDLHSRQGRPSAGDAAHRPAATASMCGP